MVAASNLLSTIGVFWVVLWMLMVKKKLFSRVCFGKRDMPPVGKRRRKKLNGTRKHPKKKKTGVKRRRRIRRRMRRKVPPVSKRELLGPDWDRHHRFILEFGTRFFFLSKCSLLLHYVHGN